MSTVPATAGGKDERLVGRSYTRARKHRMVIGHFPGGGRLWGGPYTVPQLIVMTVSFILLMVFRPLWAHFGMIVNVLVAVLVPYALALAVRRIHVDSRSPLAVVGSVFGLLAAPTEGRIGGKSLKTTGRTSFAQGRCTLTWQPAPVPAAAPSARQGGVGPMAASSTPQAPGEVGTPAADTVPRNLTSAPQVRSGVGALLAARNAAATAFSATSEKEARR